MKNNITKPWIKIFDPEAQIFLNLNVSRGEIKE